MFDWPDHVRLMFARGWTPSLDSDWLAMFAETDVLVVAAFALLVPVVLFLRRGKKRQAVEPAGLLGLYLLLTALHFVLPGDIKVRLPFEFIALFALLVSIGRSAFLLIVKVVLGRWIGRPISKILKDVIQAAIYVAALLLTLDASGVSPASLFTGSALITAAIGLSMRDTLGNLFAGLAIQAQRPFDVGDWVQFDEQPHHVGRVLEINWRATKVMTLDEVEVIIPNATLAQAPIRNFTKPEKYSRRSVYVVAPYDVPTRKVQRILLEALADAWGVLKTPAPSVVTHAFTESGVEYWIRFFTAEFAGRDRVDGGVRDRIWYAFARNGIPLPYPHRQVQLEHVTQEAVTLAEGARIAARREALQSVDFLRVLPDTVISRLAAAAKRRSYAEGELVIRQGEHGSDFFIITGGEVAVRCDCDGQMVELTRLRAPQFFGEMSCMTGQPRSATIAVTQDCDVLVIGKADLAPILAEAPELAEHISETLAMRQMELDQRTTERDGRVGPDVIERRRDLLERIRQFFSL